MDSRARAWCFTVNNYEIVPDFGGWGASYVIVGEETGENNTPHLQGYVHWAAPKRFSAMQKLLPRAHLEIAKGNATQNREYCTKQKLLHESGVLPVQGKRSDLDNIVELVTTGHAMRDIIPVARNYQGLRTAELLLKYVEPGRAPDNVPQVVWCWGSTGTGKSRWAHETYPHAWRCSDTLAWFDGYDQHDEVIIDDFRGDMCKFHWLLKLLDRYPLSVPVKGGFRQWCPKVIVITSPYPPTGVYNQREDIGQLIRRITVTREFGTDVPGTEVERVILEPLEEDIQKLVDELTAIN